MSDHPNLWGTFNSDGFNEDEYNGAGNNWPIEPAEFDSFEALVPLILTASMAAVFDRCADLVVAPVPYIYTVPPEKETLVIPRRAA